MTLETQISTDSQFSSESWTTGESSQRTSESGRGYSDGESYQCIATLSGHSGAVTSLAVTGGLIYSGGSDGSDIRVWSQPTMTEICRFGSGDGAVKALLVGAGHVFSAHQDMKIRVWKSSSSGTKGPKMVASLPTLKDYLHRCVPPKNYVHVRRHKTSLWIQHHDAISVLAMGAGDILYSGSWDKSIKLWRTTDFKCLESIIAHDDAVSALVSDQHGCLYSASADTSIKVWEKHGEKHSLVATFKGHKSSVNALIFSPDQALLYAASSDKTVSVWERCKVGDEEHMKLVATLRGHRQAVLCLATVGNILCTGSADKTIRVWRRSENNTHTLVTILEGHRGAVKSVCVSMEAVQMGVMVYSGSIDRSVKVWWLAPCKDDASEDDTSPFAASPFQLKWRI